MKSLLQTLLDMGYTLEDATDQIAEAREVMNDYVEEGDFESAENICQEYWGLEPDYIMDLM